MLLAEIRHFAETISCAQHIQQFRIFRNPDLAGSDRKKRLTEIALFDHNMIDRKLVPTRNTQYFPQFDISKIFKKRDLTQDVELLTIRDIFLWLLQIAKNRNQIT